MYVSQLWCDFRKADIHRLHVAYNFGCSALYNLPWRVSVSSHLAECNIPTFEAFLWQNVSCFLIDAQSPTMYYNYFYLTEIKNSLKMFFEPSVYD